MSDSLSHDIYSDPGFVERYAASLHDNPWNALYERPASLSLLRGLHGKKVLDAGCGPGITAELFIGQGAVVTAIDYSREMIRLTRERTKGEAQTQLADLNNGLGDFPEHRFDVIYCSLVIHYIDDLPALFGEFARVLVPGGIVVFSTDHPESRDCRENKVVQKQRSKAFWGSYNRWLDIYLRPWSEIEAALSSAKLSIDRILEPEPLPDCADKFPKEYEYLSSNPHFICVRACKRS
jgi:SAM-dependent methyltransferase